MCSKFAWVESAVTWSVVVLGLGITSGAFAQSPVSSFEQLSTRLRVGDVVAVTDAAGVEHKGKIGDLTPSSLSLLENATPRDFRKENVSAIKWQQPDSLGNGALIGLGIGLGFGAVGAVLACGGGDCVAGDAPYIALAVAMYGGIGSAIGVGIDALVPGKKVLIYSAPSASSGARVSLSPLVSPSGQGLAVSIRF